MEGSSHTLNYQDAAERLLVALSSIAQKFPDRPIPAIKLVALAFAPEVRQHWRQRETARRRIRDTIFVARQQLSAQATAASPASGGAQVIGTGAGYFITGDRRIIAWYAAQRRRAGLTALRASSQTKRTLSAQPSLFPDDRRPCGDGTAKILTHRQMSAYLDEVVADGAEERKAKAEAARAAASNAVQSIWEKQSSPASPPAPAATEG